METIWEGRIAGVFEGYRNGRTYELSDGSRRRQEDRREEYVHREQPKAKLLRDQSINARRLDVEGTSSVVIVVKEEGRRGLTAGAF
jgi:hypothetical protein